MRGRSIAVLVVCGVVALGAQTARPTFEVASVKPNLSSSTSSMQDVRPGGLFIATNRSVATLIQFAYQLPGYQIAGGPEWVRTSKFDVNAKAAGDVPNE